MVYSTSQRKKSLFVDSVSSLIGGSNSGLDDEDFLLLQEQLKSAAHSIVCNGRVSRC